MSACALSLALVLFAGSPACEGAEVAVRAAPGEAFRLEIGQSAALEEGSLEIRFEGVPSDSRCRKGEACVWAGDAVVRLSMRNAGRSETIELHASSRGPAAVGFDDWLVELLALEPPRMAAAEQAPAYVATLRVARGESGKTATQ
jgi:hypothetical protein